MLKFVENFFNFKVTWKLRMKIVYLFAKVHGLAHFVYDENTNKVRYSGKSTVYGWVWAIYYLLFLTLFWSSLTELVDDGDGSAVLFFVNATELTTVVSKAFIIYFLQIIQSKDLVVLINDAVVISQMIHSEHSESVNLYSHRFVRLCNFKKRCIVIQSILLFGSHCLYVAQAGYKTINAILGGLIAYTHFSTVLIGGYYLYGCLLFGYEFYYSLNGKLIQILNLIKANTKLQSKSYGQVHDELDRILFVYTRISVYVASINRLFAVQVTLQLLASFIQITSAVSIDIEIMHNVTAQRNDIAAAMQFYWLCPMKLKRYAVACFFAFV